MKRLLVYADASIIGGCEDDEFAADSLALWRTFIRGDYVLVLSEHTLRELTQAPEAVRRHLTEVPRAHLIVLTDSPEADDLANAYLERGVVGPSSRSDAIHVALATVAGADVLASWNFRHIVNLDKIRRFNAVNLEKAYGSIEIRSPKEVTVDEEGI